ncbi:MAG: Gamma-glutamyltranspeptidase [Variovorax sp.]|nr:Gamma-glutamyltranspeptidase [Variovorax sp.]
MRTLGNERRKYPERLQQACFILCRRADLHAIGSPLILDDLRRHTALDRTPLRLEHSMGRIYNMPPPTQSLVSLIILGRKPEIDGDGLTVARY